MVRLTSATMLREPRPFPFPSRLPYAYAVDVHSSLYSDAMAWTSSVEFILDQRSTPLRFSTGLLDKRQTVLRCLCSDIDTPSGFRTCLRLLGGANACVKYLSVRGCAVVAHRATRGLLGCNCLSVYFYCPSFVQHNGAEVCGGIGDAVPRIRV